jgi:hypothetical protein
MPGLLQIVGFTLRSCISASNPILPKSDCAIQLVQRLRCSSQRGKFIVNNHTGLYYKSVIYNLYSIYKLLKSLPGCVY